MYVATTQHNVYLSVVQYQNSTIHWIVQSNLHTRTLANTITKTIIMTYQDYEKELLVSENEHINRLNEIVVEAIKEEALITQKLYEESPADKPIFRERISERLPHLVVVGSLSLAFRWA